MTARVTLFLVSLLLAALLAACGAAAQPGTGEPIALEPCQIGTPGLAARRPARCGVLMVFEDRAAGQGRTIELRIAVVLAVSRGPAADPLFLLAGGPGQSAVESYLPLAGALGPINQRRDIVLVDQRGTGGSHPLHCPAFDSDLAQPAEPQLATQLAACAAQLDADPRQYTTSSAVGDLDQARAALGYQQINLYGISYGTRVALTYLRAHADRVRSVILDGVVPQDVALGLAVAPDAQRALDMIFDRCAAEADCAAAFPDVRAEFGELLARLERAPVRLSVAHPISGAPTDLTFTRAMLATSVRLLSYAPETAALLPLLIHTAHASGDLRTLAAQALLVSTQLGSSISSGVNLAVLCAEDVPFFGAPADSGSAAGYLGSSEIDQLRAACAAWPHGVAPAGFKQPVESAVPTLLLSGAADPVTPPVNADRVAATLRNSLHLVAPGQGHNVLMRGCLPRLAAGFVERASVAGLDSACVRDIRPMPFFTSFAGTAP